MYINKTTAEERLVIDNAIGSAFNSLERAHRMPYQLWEDHFGSPEQKAISADVAVNVGDLIYTIDEIIFNALLEYRLLTGDGTFGGVRPHLDSAERAAKALRVEELSSSVLHFTYHMERKQREKAIAKRNELLKLSDDEAIPALELLLEELKGGVVTK